MTEKKPQIVSKAVATQWGFDTRGGYEVVVVMFELRGGTRDGQSHQWTGFFGDANSIARTLDSLRHCGWTGETLGDMTGMGDAEVNVVIETKEHNGKTYEEIKWVNRPPRLFLKSPMNQDALKRFSENMARLTADNKRAYGAPPESVAKPAQNAPVATPPAGEPEPYDGPPDDFDNIPF